MTTVQGVQEQLGEKNKCYRWLNSKQKLQNPLLVTSAYLKSNEESLLEKTLNSRLKPKKHGDWLHQFPPKAPDLAKPATGQNLMKRDSNVSGHLALNSR